MLDSVKRAAKPFNVDPLLIQAIVDAEGGPDALVRAVQKSIPSVATLNEALRITCRTVCRRAVEWCLKYEQRAEFIDWFGNIWAPQEVANDPTDLNANWPRNVRKLYEKARLEG